MKATITSGVIKDLRALHGEDETVPMIASLIQRLLDMRFAVDDKDFVLSIEIINNDPEPPMVAT